MPMTMDLTIEQVDRLMIKWVNCENCDKFITFQPKTAPVTKGYCSFDCIKELINKKQLEIADDIDLEVFVVASDVSTPQPELQQGQPYDYEISRDMDNLKLEPDSDVLVLPISKMEIQQQSQSESGALDDDMDFQLAERPIKELDLSDSELDYSSFVAPILCSSSNKSKVMTSAARPPPKQLDMSGFDAPVTVSAVVSEKYSSSAPVLTAKENIPTKPITSMGFPPAGSIEGKLGYGQPGCKIVTKPINISVVTQEDDFFD